MFDIEKAKLCASKMKDYFDSNEEVANVEIPTSIKMGSNDHIFYIFYSCLLDYGMRSKTYNTNLIKTYENYKDIFNPSYVVKTFKNNKINLFNIIKENIHPRYPNIALKKWLELSEFLNTNYPDDKINLNNDDLKKLGTIWIKAGKTNNISAGDIDRYLWSIGTNLCLKKKCNE